MGTSLKRYDGPEGFDISELRRGSLGHPDDIVTLKFALPTYYYQSFEKEPTDKFPPPIDHIITYGADKLVKSLEEKIAKYKVVRKAQNINFTSYDDLKKTQHLPWLI